MFGWDDEPQVQVRVGAQGRARPVHQVSSIELLFTNFVFLSQNGLA